MNRIQPTSRLPIMTPTAANVCRAARGLAAAADALAMGPPVTHAYNPLHYAWAAHEAYITRYANGPKRVVFLGMNPGPYGMVQTGIPFGEVAAVRDWMGITASIGRPERPHPKRPVAGFDCTRSEVSGRRLWGLFAARFGAAVEFFAQHFVVNYCPLALFDAPGRNVTPDKLGTALAAPLFAACDEHLRRLVEALQPAWVIGVGDFAEKRARQALTQTDVQIGRVLHPSPASPPANRGWAEAATKQLSALGVWM